jgi:hypothetical protein
MKRRLASSPILAGLVLLACSEARTPTEPTVGQPSLAVTSGTTRCVGLLSGTFENVEVPPGATCFLNGSRVLGSVKALEDARLFVVESDVRGNVDGDKADVVHVVVSTVGGNIQIKEGTSPGASGASIFGTFLEQGNLQIEKMSTGSISMSHTFLAKGNIKLEENSTTFEFAVNASGAPSGNIQVFKNSGTGINFVAENLAQAIQCFENRLVPFIGGPNTAPTKQGQCF